MKRVCQRHDGRKLLLLIGLGIVLQMSIHMIGCAMNGAVESKLHTLADIKIGHKI